MQLESLLHHIDDQVAHFADDRGTVFLGEGRGSGITCLHEEHRAYSEDEAYEVLRQSSS